MIVRAIVAPGSERIIEQIFSSEGEECLRYPVAIAGVRWAEVVRRVLDADYGTPIGYARRGRPAYTNPPPSAPVSARALYILVGERQSPTAEGLRTALDRAAAERPQAPSSSGERSQTRGPLSREAPVREPR